MIPFEEYGDAGPPLHFLHANGYPPSAYRLLLEYLSVRYHVYSMRMRPLWPGANPDKLKDWLLLADDLERFLGEQRLNQPASSSRLIGVGHSVGATTTLHLALRRPDLFHALVLIEPVLFPPWMILFWNLITHLGLAAWLHPLVRSTLRRRNTFDNRQVMFENYRRKSIFRRLTDESLWLYVDSLACDQPRGGIELCYQPKWEARVYLTGLLKDMSIWSALPQLQIPTLLLRGELSNIFWPSTVRRFQRKLPAVHIETIPATTHLLPLEKPVEVDQIITAYLSTLEKPEFRKDQSLTGVL
jgi:pimeloyl-ACP methyl ester carboxylesterase